MLLNISCMCCVLYVKMVKLITKWRMSASLIVLSSFNSTISAQMPDVRIKVLLLSRSERASYLPKSSVFPGGIRELCDESLKWVKHFKIHGVKQKELSKLILNRNPYIEPQPTIFKTEDECARLQRDLSLRITAIRETFEEMGILLCRQRGSLENKANNFSCFHEDFDRKYWQHRVHQNPEQFLNLCQELDVVPDLWSLKEWSVWLTPAIYKTRFETAFYLTTLKEPPNVLLELKEGADYKWLSPKEALLLHSKGEIFLPLPQLFEISRLLNFNEFEELQNFAAKQSLRGAILMLPVQFKCNDGMVSIFPGDTHYPVDPYSVTELKDMRVSMAEFRCSATRLHRLEENTLTEWMWHQNLEPIDDHKKPLNIKPIFYL